MNVLRNQYATLMLLVLAVTLPASIFSYSLGIQASPQTYVRNVNGDEVCNNGHGIVVGGQCWTGELTVIKYAKGAFIYRNPSNPNDPMNEQCIAGCVVLSQQTGVYNTLVNTGKAWIRDLLLDTSNGTVAVGTIKYISLANATFTPNVKSGACCGAGLSSSTIVDSGLGGTGLVPAAATFANTGVGTATQTKTFTLAIAATATIVGAGLQTSVSTFCSSAGCTASACTTGPGTCNLVAEATFATVTLNTGDSLQVQWSITIS